MRLLAIETSCDETAASIVERQADLLVVRAHTVSSQVDLHAQWGGVVPNLAAREHVKNMVPVLTQTLKEASLTPEEIDAIAVTEGPGLIPALLIGVSTAKALSLAWEKPLLGVNHLEGHIYANLLSENATLSFPLLALIVSGGHTELILMRDHFQYEKLGETEDDAAGEAFDKVAKMLGLPYPGGPEIAKRADAFRQAGKGSNIIFPRPMLETENFNFSFSGLKTAVLYRLRKEPRARLQDEDFRGEVAFAFQEAVVDVLVGKTEKAHRLYQPKTVVIAGGVSANVRLRERTEALVKNYPTTQFLMPPLRYSLDNATMIGVAGLLRFERMTAEARENLKNQALLLEPNANLTLA